MPSPEAKPGTEPAHRLPSERFASYCAAQREQRMNSGDEFDSELFDEAAEMVLRKLRRLEDEGWK